jgi:hypothetical protein
MKSFKFQGSRFHPPSLRFGAGEREVSRFQFQVLRGRGGSTPHGGTSASHALQGKRAGFIGIRRKPLILTVIDGL